VSTTAHEGLLLPAARVAVANSAVLVSSAMVIVVASTLYGATRQTDAYLVSRALTDLIVAVLAMSSSVVAIPVLIRIRREHGESAARDAGRTLLWSTIVLLALVSIAVWIARDAVASLIAPGFNEEDRALTVRLLAFTLPASTLMGSVTILTGLLNARHRFFVAAIAPAMTSVVIVASMVIFRDGGVIGWAIGYLAGALVSTIALLLALWPLDRMFPPRARLGDQGFRAILIAAAPLVLVQLSLQAATIVVRVIASTLAPGVITALNLALTLTNIPLAVFAYALATVLVPALAQSVDHDTRRFKQLYARGLRAMVVVLTPAALGIAVLAQPLVRVLLQRGAFDDTATSLTAEVLGLYALSLSAQPFLVIGYRSLIAAARTRLVAMVEVSLNALLILLTFVLAVAFAQRGIAAAYVCAAAAGAAIYVRISRRTIGGSLGNGFASFYFRVIGASAAAAGSMLWIIIEMGSLKNSSTAAVGLFGSAAFGGIVYLTAALALRIVTVPQIRTALSSTNRSLRRSGRSR
jgi:putative peptidoglycan lipid II flippase